MTLQTECRNESLATLNAYDQLSDLREKCLYWFAKLGEASTNDVARELGTVPSNITQAVNTLRKRKQIEAIGKKPDPKTGKRNTVYITTNIIRSSY